jgi:hypothetical protein
MNMGDVPILLSYAAFLLLFSLDRLQHALFSDEIAYAMASQGPAIRISFLLIKMVTILDDIPFRWLVQLVGLVLLIALVLLFVLAWRFGKTTRILYFTVLLVISRVVFAVMGGNATSHPPLSSVPPFVVSSILGVHDMSFKLSSFLLYPLFVWGIYKMLLARLSFAAAYFLALAVGTLPLLWHMGAIVEQSFWGAICFILILTNLITSNQPHYGRLVSFGSIAALMRQPAFLALLPIVATFALATLSAGKQKAKFPNGIVILSPVLLFAPFLIKSLVVGTPSTGTLTTAAFAVHNIANALENGTVWAAVANSVPYWWILFIPLAIVPMSREALTRNAAFFMFAAAAVAAYYAINPRFHGAAKYQAEYAAPLAVAGATLFFLKLSGWLLGQRALPLLAIGLVLLNIVDFVRIPTGNKPVDTLADTMWDDMKVLHGGYRILCAFPYNMNAAYRAIKREGLSESSYSAGVTYGILPEIMNGYSVRAIRIVADIAKKQQKIGSGSISAHDIVDAIEADHRIKVVIAAFAPNRKALVSEFQLRGWRITGAFMNHEYGSSVLLIQR